MHSGANRSVPQLQPSVTSISTLAFLPAAAIAASISVRMARSGRDRCGENRW